MLLTIDIGTSTFKFAVWDYNGNRLSLLLLPLKAKNNIETDPSVWIDTFNECCKRTRDLSKIEAIIISGNGPTLVPVPKKNNPQENARLWTDRRAEKYNLHVSDLMQGYVDAGFFLPKILYIKNEEESLYNNTDFFVGCPEYLAYKLTGNARTVFPCKGFDRWFWNDDVLEKLKLDKEKFPSFINPGDEFGLLSASNAEYFGFKKNIPVISGGPDFFASILGSGITEPETACNRTGTSDGINLCTENYIKHDKLMSYSHPIEPYWNLSGIIGTSGKMIEEKTESLNIKNIDDFFDQAQSNIEAKNVLENISFRIKDILNIMKEMGQKTNKIHVSGGLSDYSYFNQIKADITEKVIIEGAFKEAELLGLFIIGAFKKGIYSSYKEASSALYKIKRCYEPDYSKKDLYNNRYFEYKEAKEKI
ncbi:MAG: FGGY-family carbohydrate kinase [Treponema sp.]|nr:FGGY-family carbohydrate kinase [Treponema sp.]